MIPPAAAEVFGPSLPLAERYAEILTSAGIERGLLGPREADRIWDRHLLNSAVVAELVPSGSRVVDVGSGAGLPGLAVALARPDLSVTLLEPLLRRTRFLDEAVSLLGLRDRVRVVRARAEERPPQSADIVLARAVAPLDRLVRWCLPLVEPGGWLLALKGSRAEAELAEHAGAVRRAGGVQANVVTCGSGVLDSPTIVLRVQRGPGTREARTSS